MQIESMLAWIDVLLPIGGELVDFCAGGGHLGLVIAAARPDSRVYLVEKKKQHVEIARRRIEIIGLVRPRRRPLADRKSHFPSIVDMTCPHHRGTEDVASELRASAMRGGPEEAGKHGWPSCIGSRLSRIKLPHATAAAAAAAAAGRRPTRRSRTAT